MRKYPAGIKRYTNNDKDLRVLIYSPYKAPFTPTKVKETFEYNVFEQAGYVFETREDVERAKKEWAAKNAK